jgi:hypothetical protein
MRGVATLRTKQRNLETLMYDYIIVGAGSAVIPATTAPVGRCAWRTSGTSTR